MTEERPFFTVVVATYNRAAALHRCLAALEAQDFHQQHYEVLVVDDGSTEDLPAVVKNFAGRMDVRLVRSDRRGPAAARNLGAAHARGRVLAFTDSDCRPAQAWLSALHEVMQATTGAAVGGHTDNELKQNLFAEASQCLIDFLYRYYNPDPADAKFLTSNNLAVPGERFRSLGGFEERFERAAGEDRDFCDRWADRGWPMLYEPAAIVRHEHHMGLLAFWRQHVNYGRGARLFRTLRAARGREPVRIEPMGFYTGIGKAAFHGHTGFAALALAVLMGVAQLANALGFFLGRTPELPGQTSSK